MSIAVAVAVFGGASLFFALISIIFFIVLIREIKDKLEREMGDSLSVRLWIIGISGGLSLICFGIFKLLSSMMLNKGRGGDPPGEENFTPFIY